MNVFKISRTGKLTTLYGFAPRRTAVMAPALLPAGLVQGSDGNFYRTTHLDGPNAAGTVFKISPSGKLTTLHSFCSVGPDCADGGHSFASLVQATDGNFYGTTFDGGAQYRGVVFRNLARRRDSYALQLLLPIKLRRRFLPLRQELLQATNGIFYGGDRLWRDERLSLHQFRRPFRHGSSVSQQD